MRVSTQTKSNIGYLATNANLEASVLSLMPQDNFKTYFSSRLRSAEASYWQTISEMRAIHIFHNIIDVPVVGVEARTVGDKSVDFVCDWKDKKVYVEVKGFVPEDFEIARQGSSCFNKSGYESMLERAYRRAEKKFFDDNFNIVVIADENVVKSSLFREPLLYDLPKDVLWDYRKISAVVVLGEYNNEDMLKYKIWYNANPQCYLPADLVAKFDKGKSNTNYSWQN